MAVAPKSYCTIIGGPNGSGKSTIYGLLDPVGQFINADIIARGISPDAPERASLAAGRAVLRRLSIVTARGEDFIYETTLSSHQSLALMSRCKELGYEVALVFVALDSVDLNIRRIAERVAQGGHDIPEHIVRRRHKSAFARLPEAIRLADKTLIFDNSSIEPEMLLSLEFGTIVRNSLAEGAALHGRLAEAVATALDVSRDVVFRTARRE